MVHKHPSKDYIGKEVVYYAYTFVNKDDILDLRERIVRGIQNETKLDIRI